MVAAAEGSLTKAQRKKLSELEEVIEAGLQSFVDVGKALLKIRDGQLYVDVAGTWESYCKKRWNFSARRAYQLIDATEATENVKNFSHSEPPITESHAAALAGIEDPKDQAAAWDEAVQTAPKDDEGNPKITAAHVASVASQYVEEEPEPKKKPSNIIGELRERIGAYLKSAVTGQPAYVRIAIADYLEDLAQQLRN